jgi:lipid-A-disaccharide synthase
MIEINTLLPIMVRAAKIINSRLKSTQFIIARYPALPSEIYEDAVRDSGLDIKIAGGDAYNVMAGSDFAMVASGTATLETAIIGTPLVVVYKVKLLTYIIYKFVATISFLGIVNIIAGREIAPEFLQYDATPQNIADRIVPILSDPNKQKTMREELEGVRSSLGAPGASMRAAQAILPLLK